MTVDQTKQQALDFLAYVAASPTAAHAARETGRRLQEAGFSPADETDPWDFSPGACFFVRRNHTSIVAVRVGRKPPIESGARILGAHTDFPGLRLKPNPLYTKCGYLQMSVEVYGSPLLHTWTDRDLGLAGRAIVRSAAGKAETMLYDIPRPIGRIPNLAPHIRPEKSPSLTLNKQAHLPPILALHDEAGKTPDANALRTLLALALGEEYGATVDPEAITAYTAEPYDLQPGALAGLEEEFIVTRSYDNLASCHAALGALLGTEPQDHTQIIALFDNEEVGSQTMQGAGSCFLDNVIERLCADAARPREAFFQTIARSFVASVDGAHAVHPNYQEAHEPHHHPLLGKGPVVKINANERYTNQLEAHDLLQTCAQRSNVTLQSFVARTDVGTGSTIGPMTATRLGIRSIDLGNPMLAMHSIREMAGTADQVAMAKLLGAFLA